MKTVNAYGSGITPHLARVAVIGTGKQPETVHMHPAQLCSIESLFEIVAIESIKDLKSIEDLEAVRRLAKEYQPSTFMGIRIEQDVTMRADLLEFRDKSGAVIASITNLGIPVGFEDNSAT